jgi:sodium/potassium-transporting ATPase subunit alpha
VEMSSLTGESDAIECSVQRRSDVPAEARNFVFNSTLVMNGDGRGVVVRTADHTLIGAIAGLASGTTATRSNLEREVGRSM